VHHTDDERERHEINGHQVKPTQGRGYDSEPPSNAPLPRTFKSRGAQMRLGMSRPLTTGARAITESVAVTRGRESQTMNIDTIPEEGEQWRCCSRFLTLLTSCADPFQIEQSSSDDPAMRMSLPYYDETLITMMLVVAEPKSAPTDPEPSARADTSLASLEQVDKHVAEAVSVASWLLWPINLHSTHTAPSTPRANAIPQERICKA